MPVKPTTLVIIPNLLAAAFVFGTLAGCAGRPPQPDLTPAQWKYCLDQHLMLAQLMAAADSTASPLLGEVPAN